MRLRRECSKPSRQLWENVNRDSSGGCVLPMGRPSPDCRLPSGGDKDGTVTRTIRTAIVPGSQYLRKNGASDNAQRQPGPKTITAANARRNSIA